MDAVKIEIKRAFWFTLAVIFLFESWLWDNVKKWLRALGHALGVQHLRPWLADLVARLSPPLTLALFVVPAALVLPFKIGALGLIAHGHVVSGLVAIFLAKTLALGVTSYLFDECRDKLLRMAWFARLYSQVLDARAWAHTLVAPYKARLAPIIAALRARLAALGAKDGALAGRIARLRKRVSRLKRPA